MAVVGYDYRALGLEFFYNFVVVFSLIYFRSAKNKKLIGDFQDNMGEAHRTGPSCLYNALIIMVHQ
jgi:hypothetical protein